MLPLYFPRDKHEEEVAILKLPADVGDENGETIIDERKIRIKPLPKKIVPKPPQVEVDPPVSDVGLVRRLVTWDDAKSNIIDYIPLRTFLVIVINFSEKFAAFYFLSLSKFLDNVLNCIRLYIS